MDGSSNDGTDDSHLKAVSSLRARFENVETTSSSQSTVPSSGAKVPPPKPSTKLHAPKPFLLPDRGAVHQPVEHNGGLEKTDGSHAVERIPPVRPKTPSDRRVEINGQHRQALAGPSVNFTSPKSPSKTRSPGKVAALRERSPKAHATAGSDLQELFACTGGSHALPEKTGISSRDLQRYDKQRNEDSGGCPSKSKPSNSAAASSSKPPPVNRAAKPLLGSRGVEATNKNLAADTKRGIQQPKTSPFNTPPSSAEPSPTSTPPAVPSASKPAAQALPSSTIEAGPSLSGALGQPSAARKVAPAPPPSRQSRLSSLRNKDSSEDSPERKLDIPPRTDSLSVNTHVGQDSQPLPQRRSLNYERPQLYTQTSAPLTAQPRKSSYPAFDAPKISSHAAPQRQMARTPPPAPAADVSDRSHKPPKLSATRIQLSETRPTIAQNVVNPTTDFPDSSQANRRPPHFRLGAKDISTGYDAKIFDVCGDFVCTSGALTRVWDIYTGKLVFSMSQPETTKITAVAFKPMRNIEEEGKKLWLGSNIGEIQEIDIENKQLVATSTSAHPRREIIRIYRHAAELWTIDEDGKVYVWPAGSDGSPSLDNGVHSGRIPKGHSTSVIVGNRLWVASGKDIRIFQPHANISKNTFQITPQSIAKSGHSDITACAMIPDQPDCVYFGHSDGKVTAYSREAYEFLGVSNVAQHKINCIAGVGSYLWAGFNTGMILMYDTTTRPWKTKKRWQAHAHPVLDILMDRTSLWKLDRLQVVSLGVDNMICIWDGMLEEDWIEDDMQASEPEFCSYSDATALVMTWNAGASKPADLRHDEQDSNFFRELLQAQEPPEILVFGLQELVDLDDKKLTAKSLFKSKQKDAYGQEHLSRAYRTWRDHLTSCIDDCVPGSDSYALLHTASLVGLFTCIFVKTSLRPRIRDVQAAEVKTGMGGLHGNKGALLLRLTLDDTTLCLLNCHLAAGQTQTPSRNADVASILSTPHLPFPALKPQASAPDALDLSTLYVNGGDGRLPLDHALCILAGDLNYRIDTMGRDTVAHAVKSANLAKLRDRDQLLLSRRKNPSFGLRDFQEGEIAFAPTYKYDVGTDRYDSSDKKRAPAWCDRILFRGGGAVPATEGIRLLRYGRHEVRTSDHRPVSALFALRLKSVVDREGRAQCRLRAEERFHGSRRRAAGQAKLDYLTDVFGLSVDEARRLLGS